MKWRVIFTKNAAKQYEKLKRSGSKKPSIIDTIDVFAMELEETGPNLRKWPNFGPLGKNKYHCHLLKGRPTYVACWSIQNLQAKIIEVYYVGTHEAAPY